jgi:hypothetical protein
MPIGYDFKMSCFHSAILAKTAPASSSLSTAVLMRHERLVSIKLMYPAPLSEAFGLCTFIDLTGKRDLVISLCLGELDENACNNLNLLDVGCRNC